MKGTVAVVAVVVVAACRRSAPEAEPEAPPVETWCVPASPTTLADTRALRGAVVSAPEHSAVLAPQVAGRLVRVFVREADRVRPGMTVAEVESAPAHDALVQARAQLAEAEAAARNAATTLARGQYLFGRGIVARQEVDDATARRAQADAAVAQARAAVEIAARNVARTQLRATLAGVVVRVIRQPGELVDGTPATPVLEVADPTALEFQGAAPPADLVTLRPGQHARVRFDALPGRDFTATVRAVAPSIAPSTGVGTVRLSLDAGGGVPLGLFGAADVTVGERAGVVTVPQTALRNGGPTGTEVIACEAGRAHVRAVEVGARQGELAEVVRGIAPGTRVAVREVLALTDGTPIREVPPDGGGR